jgi:hypothetical protein
MRGQRGGFRGGIDSLLATVSDDERADLEDLLLGEPYLSHTAVTAVLAKHYADHPALARLDISKPTAANDVGDWRRGRGVRLR